MVNIDYHIAFGEFEGYVRDEDGNKIQNLGLGIIIGRDGKLLKLEGHLVLKGMQKKCTRIL